MSEMAGEEPLLVVQRLAKWYGRRLCFRAVSFALAAGEVTAGASACGAGRTTLLPLVSLMIGASSRLELSPLREGITPDLATLDEVERRLLARTDWGFVHQDPAMGLRMRVSAGANVGERLMALGARHYGRIRDTATNWLHRVEIDASRI